MDGALIACLAGLGGGAVLGLAARAGRFCMMGAIEDAVYGADTERLRMLAIAAASAIAGTALLIAAGGLDPAATLYLRTGWSPAASVIGGLAFGYGMAQVGTCGFGALARAGGGDLRSVVIAATVGVAGYAALSGPLAALRTALLPPETALAGQPSIAALLAEPFGLPPALPALLVALAFALAARAGRRPRRASVGWGVAAGLAVPFAWGATSAASGGFAVVPVEAFSFVAPLGETVMAAMTAELRLPDFSISAVIGVVAGAAIGAHWREGIRWEACDDARELRRQLFGAGLMGVGGVVALGCSVGQGLSALSVLALGAPLTVVSILLGARLGLYVLVEAPG
ncbi:MAG: YeeE/YedE family protein [Paracoccaceae bacterium]